MTLTLDLTGWRGDFYSGSLPYSAGHFIGSIIGGAILFGIVAVIFNGLSFIKNKIVGVFK